MAGEGCWGDRFMERAQSRRPRASLQRNSVQFPVCGPGFGALPLGQRGVLPSNRAAMIAAERARLTFRRDCWRMLAVGVLESAGHTFLLLIAVLHFQAGAIPKALIAAGGSVGLLFSPLAVSWVTRWRWPATLGASRLLWIGAGACVLAAAVNRI